MKSKKLFRINLLHFHWPKHFSNKRFLSLTCVILEWRQRATSSTRQLTIELLHSNVMVLNQNHLSTHSTSNEQLTRSSQVNSPSIKSSSKLLHSKNKPLTSKLTVKRIFWFSVCILGTILQVIQVSNIYFSYKITTVVTMNYPEYISRPSLTICFYTVEIYDWNKVGEVNLVELEKLGLKEASKITNSTEALNSLQDQVRADGFGEKIIYTGIVNNNATSREIMSRSLNYSTFILGCYEISNKDYRYHANKLCSNFKETTYMREMQKCIRIDSKLPSTEYSSILLNQIVSQGFFFQFKVNGKYSKRISNVMYSFSPVGSFLRNGYIRQIMKETLSVSIILTYSIYRSELLPLPFETACINYQNSMSQSNFQFRRFSQHFQPNYSYNYTFDPKSIKDRGDCWEECVIINSVKYFGRIAPGVSVTGSINIPMISQYEIETNETLHAFDRKIKTKCNRKCKRPECDLSTFIPHVISSKSRELNGKKAQKVIIHAMNQPVTHAKAVQKMNFVEYLSYVATAIGFWLGLSVFDFGLTIVKKLIPLARSTWKTQIGHSVHVSSPRKRKSSERFQSILSFIHVKQSRSASRHPMDQMHRKRLAEMIDYCQHLNVHQHPFD